VRDRRDTTEERPGALAYDASYRSCEVVIAAGTPRALVVATYCDDGTLLAYDTPMYGVGEIPVWRP